jgi:hypothetical protein
MHKWDLAADWRICSGDLALTHDGPVCAQLGQIINLGVGDACLIAFERQGCQNNKRSAAALFE